MATINPYLTFNGNCEEAFIFYRSVFGGDFYLYRYSEMPLQDGQSMHEEVANKVMHIALPFYDCPGLMGCDTVGEEAQGYTAGNNFSISINGDNKRKADKIFNSLAAGGQVTMPMSEIFDGSFSGKCTDKFGIRWVMNYESDDDLEKDYE